MKYHSKKNMIWLVPLLGLLFLIVLITIGSLRESTMTFDLQNKTPMAIHLHEIIQKNMEDGGFSGSVLVAKGDKILLSEGYGYASRYFRSAENSPDTRYLLGSMTKTFTALAILQLEEDHLLRLDDSVTRYFPEFTGWKEVTIHQLLNHTSGIPNYYESISDHIRYYLGHSTPLQIMERLKNSPLKFSPGSDFDYSNTNYMILSAIIEQVSGQTYIDYLTQQILTPMGLSDTGYSEHRGNVELLAQGYCLNMLVEVTGFNLSNFYGAGGLYSTTDDLFRLQQRIDFDKLINDRSTATINSGYDYGYGMMVTTQDDFGKAYFISGGGPGINTVMYKLADEDLTVIVLSNNQDFDTESLALNLIRVILAM